MVKRAKLQYNIVNNVTESRNGVPDSWFLSGLLLLFVNKYDDIVIYSTDSVDKTIKPRKNI